MNAVSKKKTATKAVDCTDLLYRLSIYEAGHALVAWHLGHTIVSVRMLPRPTMTETEKTFISNNWRSFYDVLEYRALELFGGQIAEELACGSSGCCSGDIPRIDEITRILAGLADHVEEPEDIFFRLEEETYQVFARQEYMDAIAPVARLLYEREMAGESEVIGADIEAVIAEYVPRVEAPASAGEKVLGLLKAPFIREA